MQTLDPVCKMTIESSTAAAQAKFNGVTYYFCMQGCKESYLPKKGLFARLKK